MKSEKKNFFFQTLKNAPWPKKKSQKFRDPYKSLVPINLLNVRIIQSRDSPARNEINHNSHYVILKTFKLFKFRGSEEIIEQD